MSSAPSRHVPHVAVLCAFLVCSLPLVARAEPSSQDKAESHALFEKGLSEYKGGHYDRALPLFQSSHQLDAGVGTSMYMAECHRPLGQSASAWGAFKEAATVAVKLGDKRDKLALEKAAEIEKTLSYLSVEVPPASRIEGLQITRDGRPVPPSLLGVATPVDPGEHTLEATAPGRKTQTSKITVGPSGARVVFALKPLEIEPAGTTADATKPPKKAAPETPSQAGAEPSPAPPQGPWRTVGFATGGVGLAAGVVGGVIALGAFIKASNTQDTAEHRGLKGPYTTGLVVASVGGALLATGAALVLTHPSPATAARLRIAPTIGGGTGGLLIGGVW